MGGSDELGGDGKLIFTLPSFPISFNRLYDVDHVRRRVRLSDEATLWKLRNSPFVKACRWRGEGGLRLTMDFVSPRWLTKDGRIRRIDLQNLEKLVIDTMFSKWGWDDSRIVERVTRKVYGDDESIAVMLEQVDVNVGQPTATMQAV